MISRIRIKEGTKLSGKDEASYGEDFFMRITLISLYDTIDWDFTTRILSAVLKKEEHETRILFIPLKLGQYRIDNNNLKQLVDLSANSGLIAVSVMTNFFSGAVKITQTLKNELDIPIIWGGIHPTIRPNECLNYADMVCVGEGEKTLVNLVKSLEKGRDVNAISGLGYKSNNNFFINDPTPLIQDLDVLPFPDYECKDDYLLQSGSVRKIDKNLVQNCMRRFTHTSKKEYTIYHTMASRGCSFACTYCCNNALKGKYHRQYKIRKRSIDNVINEFLVARGELPRISCFLINDDSFFFRSEDEIFKFAKEYKEKIGLPLWITGLHPREFDKTKFSLLVDAGLKFIRLGIQTGSDNTKKLYKRYYSNQQVIAVAKEINKFKDKIAPPSYDIILDNPWESENDLVSTLILLSKLPKPYAIELFSLSLFPGTELYNKAKKEGIINNDIQEIYNRSYYAVKPTFLNEIFKLVRDNANKGRFMPGWFFFLLINPVLRRLFHVIFILCKFGKLLNKGFHSLLIGNYSRIFAYLRRKLRK